MTKLNYQLIVLSGAGMSAESGISTFRDSNGMWKQFDITKVASVSGWQENPTLVHEFYNLRRRQLSEVTPNTGHLLLAALEEKIPVQIITQNVDDLHERAGSTRVIHLHGELRKVRSTGNPSYIADWEGDLTLDDRCPQGYPLRPHIVWFGEEVPKMGSAMAAMKHATHVFIIGTSLQVYPAAGLISYAPKDAAVWYIDPNPAVSPELAIRENLTILPTSATAGVADAMAQLLASI